MGIFRRKSRSDEVIDVTARLVKALPDSTGTVPEPRGEYRGKHRISEDLFLISGPDDPFEAKIGRIEGCQILATTTCLQCGCSYGFEPQARSCDSSEHRLRHSEIKLVAKQNDFGICSYCSYPVPDARYGIEILCETCRDLLPIEENLAD